MTTKNPGAFFFFFKHLIHSSGMCSILLNSQANTAKANCFAWQPEKSKLLRQRLQKCCQKQLHLSTAWYMQR